MDKSARRVSKFRRSIVTPRIVVPANKPGIRFRDIDLIDKVCLMLLLVPATACDCVSVLLD